MHVRGATRSLGQCRPECAFPLKPARHRPGPPVCWHGSGTGCTLGLQGRAGPHRLPPITLWSGLLSFDRADPAGKPLRAVFAGSIVVIVLLLGFFAYSLAHAQRQQRQDLEKRFRDRADISAAVTDAIFASAGAQSQVQNAARFGGSKIDPATLAKTARQSQSPYAAIITKGGKVLAATPGAPRRTPTEAPYIAKAFRTGRLELSDQLRGPKGTAAFETATPFPTTHGRRVLLAAADAKLLSQFLDGFLAEVPNVASATSYVVDSNGRLVGSTAKGVESGARLPDRELAAALK